MSFGAEAQLQRAQPPLDVAGGFLKAGGTLLAGASNVGGKWVAIARDMAVRYAGPEKGLTYLEATLGEPRWLFFVRPLRITDWTGGWAGKYKHSNW